MKTKLRILFLPTLAALLFGVAVARQNTAMAPDGSLIPIIVVPSPSEITAGAATTVTVTMNQAGTSDTVVYLSSSNSQLTVPTSVTVPTGQDSVQFTAQSSPGGGASATITASCNGSAAQGSVIIDAGDGAPVRSR